MPKNKGKVRFTFSVSSPFLFSRQHSAAEEEKTQPLGRKKRGREEYRNYSQHNPSPTNFSVVFFPNLYATLKRTKSKGKQNFIFR